MLETTIEKWKQQGVEQAKIALAKKLLQRGESVNDVAEVTELPVKTVQSLADEINS